MHYQSCSKTYRLCANKKRVLTNVILDERILLFIYLHKKIQLSYVVVGKSRIDVHPLRRLKCNFHGKGHLLISTRISSI